uniref:hypothetical protein n=1 Tax=Ulva torta TaxID=932731 RepID=UPI002208B55C|nr:hypothetical protein OOC95_pgp016 [Ulva torta]UXW92250.1 hypothetical protein [Ulva torta]
MENCRSSETIRETLITEFNFTDYIQFGAPNHKSFIDTTFLEWFIGFFEAEGCFLIWYTKNNSKRFGIEITQKDPKLMYKIKKNLGFGRVTEINFKDNKKYWRFYSSNFENLCRLIILFNGNLITSNKNIQFKLWINEINKIKNKAFIVLERNLEPSFNNSWLSGFLEGDGGFYAKQKNFIRINKDGSKAYNIKMKFYITQKNEEKLLIKIKELLNISTNIYKISNNISNVKYNRLETSKLESHLLLIKYLDNYPFLGKRFITFSRWKRLLGYRVNKYPITPKSIIKLKRLILETKNIN